jgi:hypothetical protein
MRAAVREDEAMTRWRRLPPSVDCLVEWRPPVTQERHPQPVREAGTGAVVAVAVWLLLFGLAIAALSAVARPQSAAAPASRRALDVVTPETSDWRSPSAGADFAP